MVNPSKSEYTHGEPSLQLLSRSENIQIADQEIRHIIKKMAVLILKDCRKVDDFISQWADEANVIEILSWLES